MLIFLIAALLIMHGLAHLSGVLAAWTSLPVFSSQPWIFSEGTTTHTAVGRLFSFLWLAATIGLVAAGYGLLVGYEWWSPLAVAAATLSLCAIVSWWHTVPLGAWFGALFDLLIIIALLSPWVEQMIYRLR